MKRLILLLCLSFFPIRIVASDAIHDHAKNLQTLGQYKAAIEIYQSILKENPQDSLAWFDMGVCFYNDKQFKTAYRVLRQVQHNYNLKANFKMLLHNAALYAIQEFDTLAQAQFWAESHGLNLSDFQFVNPSDIFFYYGFWAPLVDASDPYFFNYDEFRNHHDVRLNYGLFVDNPATFGKAGFNLSKAFEKQQNRNYVLALDYARQCQALEDHLYVQIMLQNLAKEACRYYLFTKDYDHARQALKYASTELSDTKEIQALSMDIRVCQKRQESIQKVLECQNYQDVKKVVTYEPPDRHAFLSPLDIKFSHHFSLELPIKVGENITSNVILQNYTDYQHARQTLLFKKGQFTYNTNTRDQETLNFPPLQEEEQHAFRGECGFLLLKAFDAAAHSASPEALDYFARAFHRMPHSWLVRNICANGISGLLDQNRQLAANTTIHDLPDALWTHASMQRQKSHTTQDPTTATQVQTPDDTLRDNLLIKFMDFQTAEALLTSSGINAHAFRFLKTDDITFDPLVYTKLGLDDALKTLRSQNANLPLDLQLRTTKWYYLDPLEYDEIFVGEIGFYLKKAFEWQTIQQSLEYFAKARTLAPQNEMLQLFYYDALLHAIAQYRERGEVTKARAILDLGLREFPDDFLLTYETLKSHYADQKIDAKIYSYDSYPQAVAYMKTQNHEANSYFHVSQDLLVFKSSPYWSSDSCTYTVTQGSACDDVTLTHADSATALFVFYAQLYSSHTDSSRSILQELMDNLAGETGFWLAKSLIAMNNGDYLSLQNYFQKAAAAYPRNDKLPLLSYNIARQATAHFSQTGQLKNAFEFVKMGAIRLNTKEPRYPSYSTPTQVTQSREKAPLDTSRTLMQKNPRAWLNNVVSLKRSYKTVRRAKALLESFLQEHPNHALAEEVRYEIGACMYWDYYGMGKGQYSEDKIISYFKHLNPQTDSLAEKAAYTIATMYRGSDSSAYYYEKMVRDFPKSHFADDALFIIAYDEPEYLPSIPKYLRIVQEYPNGDQVHGAYYRLSQLYMKTQQYEQCRSIMQQYLHTNPNPEQQWLIHHAYQVISQAALNLQDYPFLDNYFTRLYQDNPRIGFYYMFDLISMYCFELHDVAKCKRLLSIIKDQDWNLSLLFIERYIETNDMYEYLLQSNLLNWGTAKEKQELQQLFSQGAIPNTPKQEQTLLKLIRNLPWKTDPWLVSHLLQRLETARSHSPLQESNISIPIREIVAYRRANNYLDIGYQEASKAEWRKLLTQYPNSRLCDDALMKLADLEYDRDKRRAYLQRIVKRYPNGDQVEEAQGRLTYY